MKEFFSKRNFLSSIVSITLSVAFVASIAFASTTISTNVQTDGTLSVTGASTLTGASTFTGVAVHNGQLQASSTALFGGAVTAYVAFNTQGATTLGDAASDVITITGNASTTNALTIGSNLYVGGRATTTASSGNFQMMGGLTVGDATVNTLAGTILFSAQSSDPAAGTQGGVYYNSTSKVLKLSDGTSWFTIGTTTSGISLTGSRLQLGDLTTQYVTLGTTTQQGSGQALVTLESTSTTAVPLVLVGYNGQTGNLFSIRDVGSARLVYVTSAGAVFASSTGQFTGAFTTYGANTLGDAVGDSITLTGNATSTNNFYVGLALTVGGMATTTSAGNISTQGTLTVVGNATTSSLYVGGNFNVNGMATTTSAGAIYTQGKFGVATSTAPSLEISADGAATTTVGAFSSGTRIGGCIQLEGANDTMYRMYVGGAGISGIATTTPSGAAGFIAVWEAGSCK